MKPKLLKSVRKRILNSGLKKNNFQNFNIAFSVLKNFLSKINFSIIFQSLKILQNWTEHFFAKSWSQTKRILAKWFFLFNMVDRKKIKFKLSGNNSKNFSEKLTNPNFFWYVINWSIKLYFFKLFWDARSTLSQNLSQSDKNSLFIMAKSPNRGKRYFC